MSVLERGVSRRRRRSYLRDIVERYATATLAVIVKMVLRVRYTSKTLRPAFNNQFRAYESALSRADVSKQLGLHALTRDMCLAHSAA